MIYLEKGRCCAQKNDILLVAKLPALDNLVGDLIEDK